MTVKFPYPTRCCWCQKEIEPKEDVVVFPVLRVLSWSWMEDDGADPFLMHRDCFREMFSGLRPPGSKERP